MTLARGDVEKVSLLGRLLLSDDEIGTLTDQLGSILAYVELLGEVDTSNVEPMAHAIEVSNVFRDDDTRPSLPRDEAMANAPNRDDECYRVPAVLGEI